MTRKLRENSRHFLPPIVVSHACFSSRVSVAERWAESKLAAVATKTLGQTQAKR